MTQPKRQFVDLVELSHKYDVDYETVRKLANKGVFGQPVRVGRVIRVPMEGVEKFDREGGER